MKAGPAGNLTSMRLILERVEGRPQERVVESPEVRRPFTADEAAEAVQRNRAGAPAP